MDCLSLRPAAGTVQGTKGFTPHLKPKVQGDKNMKAPRILGIITIICCLSVVPAAGTDCGHYDHHCADYGDCGHDCYQRAQGGRHSRAWAPSSAAADMRTAEGRITEVVYLPGATPDSGMVEVRLQSVGQNQLIRLAPVGFLKQSGLLLREGDTVIVKGFPIVGMEGDLLVATEIHKGDNTLSLRDTRGRPAW